MLVPEDAHILIVLNVTHDALLAIAHEGMHPLIGDAKVIALWIEAGLSGGAELFLASPTALALGIRLHLTCNRIGLQAQALTAVKAILGQARFPAQARFDSFSAAAEVRRVELPGDFQEQQGKENQQEPVEIEQLAIHR